MFPSEKFKIVYIYKKYIFFKYLKLYINENFETFPKGLSSVQVCVAVSREKRSPKRPSRSFPPYTTTIGALPSGLFSAENLSLSKLFSEN